ncbi:MAG: SH3 domain-containing protein [Microvirga sp.]
MRAAILGFCLTSLVALPGPAGAVSNDGGRATKLPLPRYASLKTDRVNLREGPSKDHRTLWVFRRAGLPVEIIAEYETWRRIRDSEGTEGWVLHSLLSGRRTAVVTAPPGNKAAPPTVSLFARADASASEEAKLEAGVIGSVKNCSGTWCRIVVALPQTRGDVDGYIPQERLWGVYPKEAVE